MNFHWIWWKSSMGGEGGVLCPASLAHINLHPCLHQFRWCVISCLHSFQSQWTATLNQNTTHFIFHDRFIEWSINIQRKRLNWRLKKKKKNQTASIHPSVQQVRLSLTRSRQTFVHELLLDETQPPLQGKTCSHVNRVNRAWPNSAVPEPHLDSLCWVCLCLSRTHGHTASGPSPGGSAAGTPSWSLEPIVSTVSNAAVTMCL